ncbi:hypothetical protein [Kineococcus sp. SYSU DK005]|uniref:hypothetical protein n=1 Tax=Kineococcus sp. SYSU DK005 TaxID=3383126 RepID=UPI003D7C8BE5
MSSTGAIRHHYHHRARSFDTTLMQRYRQHHYLQQLAATAPTHVWLTGSTGRHELHRARPLAINRLRDQSPARSVACIG